MKIILLNYSSVDCLKIFLIFPTHPKITLHSGGIV